MIKGREEGKDDGREGERKRGREGGRERRTEGRREGGREERSERGRGLEDTRTSFVFWRAGQKKQKEGRLRPSIIGSSM
jgi:hypothetical protein